MVVLFGVKFKASAVATVLLAFPLLWGEFAEYSKLRTGHKSLEISDKSVRTKESQVPPSRNTIQGQGGDDDKSPATIGVLPDKRGRSSKNNENGEEDEYEDWMPDLVIMVQGPLQNFHEWCDRVMHQSDESAILVYGAYDKKPPSSYATAECRTMYIPNTTWTEGRNELSKGAYCLEEERQKKFKHWIFSDDDIIFECAAFNRESRKSNKKHRPIDCWKMFFQYIIHDFPQLHSPIMVGEWIAPLRPLMTVDFYDAALNVFDRERIHLMLPYITKEPKGTSWWLSALVQIQVGRACFPSSAFAFPIAISNPVHSEYPRGLHWEAGADLVKNNIHPYLPTAPLPQGDATLNSRYMRFLNGVELNTFVDEQMEMVGDTCDPMKQRWDDWLTSWGPTCSAFVKRVGLALDEVDDERRR
jgi:hypothetical protein